MQSKELIAVVAVAVIAVLACTFIVDNKSDDTERIGIIGAMDTEVSTIKEEMDIERIETIANMDFCIGTLGGKDIVVAQCGMGKVNAGICAQIMIMQYNATAIINTGVAGSLDYSLNIGDYIVSVDAVQHDFDATPIGYGQGEIPYTGQSSFKADEGLRTLAMWAIAECSDAAAYEARICTGDQFISGDDQKLDIVQRYGGKCCEMEGGAVAQACYLGDVPFVIIRAISDKADEEIPDFEEFSKKIAMQCAAIVGYMIVHFDDVHIRS